MTAHVSRLDQPTFHEIDVHLNLALTAFMDSDISKWNRMEWNVTSMKHVQSCIETCFQLRFGLLVWNSSPGSVVSEILADVQPRIVALAPRKVATGQVFKQSEQLRSDALIGPAERVVAFGLERPAGEVGVL
jgi:hypothetical protein